MNTPEVVIIQIRNKQTDNNKEENEGAKISFKQFSLNKPPPCFFPTLKTPSLWIGSEITGGKKRKKKNGSFKLPNSEAYVSSAHFSTKRERALWYKSKGSMTERTSIFTCPTFHVTCPYNVKWAEITDTGWNQIVTSMIITISIQSSRHLAIG